MRTLHVAVAQINAKATKVRDNLRRIHSQIKSAAAVKVDAILFAEVAIHGYDFSAKNLALAQPPDGPIGQQLSRWADRYGLTIMAGFLEAEAAGHYVSQLVAQAGAKPFAQRKHSITPDEIKAGFAPGPRERTLFRIKDVTCAVLICADTGIEGIHAELRQQGVEYLFIPTAGGGTLDQMLHEADLARPEIAQKYTEVRPRVFNTQAILPEADCKFPGWASANALGYDGKERCHQGHCMIVDRQRVMRAQIPGTIVLEHQQDQMVHAVLSFP